MPVDHLRLVRLQVADEVPAERVAVDGVLALEILGAVLPHDLDARLPRGRPCPRARRTSSPRRSSRRCRPRPGSARRFARTAQATRAITPWTPRGLPGAAVREEPSSGLQCVQRSTCASTSSTPASRQRALGGTPEVELPAAHDVRPERRRERLRRPPRPPRSSTARSPGRRPRGAARRAPRLPDADDPGEQSPPAGVQDGDAPALAVRRGRARSAGSRRSCARIGTSGSSVQRPSPGSPRAPGSARCTSVECTCRLSASRSGSAPISAHSRRRFSSTRSTSSPLMRPRFSEAYGPPLTPPSRVEKATSYGPGGRQRITCSCLSASASSHSRSFRLGSPITHAEQVLERLRRAAALRCYQPSSIRSSPSTASWSSRCGCVELLLDQRLVKRSSRSSSLAGRVVRSLPLALEIGALCARGRRRARRRGGARKLPRLRSVARVVVTREHVLPHDR